MTRNSLRALVRGLVGVLLFAQMAIAAYACPALSSTAAGGMQMSATAAATMPDCDAAEAMAGTMDPSTANLCAEHCKVGQQSDQASTLAVPAVLLNLLCTTAWVAEPALPPRAEAGSPSALVAASRPHAVLHCVYRI